MKQIQLTQGQVALVDDEDYKELSKYKWNANNSKNIDIYYAQRQITVSKNKQVTQGMHRYIMELAGYDLSGKVIDHINQNTLDNTRSNLRVCTRSQNAMNRKACKTNKSGYKGVVETKRKYLNKTISYYQAYIGYQGANIYLGLFKTKEEAYKAYCDACIKYHGEYARLA